MFAMLARPIEGAARVLLLHDGTLQSVGVRHVGHVFSAKLTVGRVAKNGDVVGMERITLLKETEIMELQRSEKGT